MCKPLINFLIEKGAFKIKHSGRYLGDHLLNTYQILIDAGTPKIVAVAGGLHSVYGTNAFPNSVEVSRKEVQDTFGETVEELAYMFSIANRPKGIESGQLLNWKTKEPLMCSGENLHYLRLMEAANLLEQRLNILRFPNINQTWVTQKSNVDTSNK